MHSHVQSTHALGEMMSSNVWECRSLGYNAFFDSVGPFQACSCLGKRLFCRRWQRIHALLLVAIAGK